MAAYIGSLLVSVCCTVRQYTDGGVAAYIGSLLVSVCCTVRQYTDDGVTVTPKRVGSCFNVNFNIVF